MSNVGKIVHENELYKIVVAQTEDNFDRPALTYNLVNKETDVIEEEARSLPMLIGLAEQSNAFLKNKLWRWAAVQGDEQGAALDDSSKVVSFEAEFEPGDLSN